MEEEARVQEDPETRTEAGRKGGGAASLAIGDLGTIPDVQPYALNWAGAFGAGLLATLAFGSIWFLLTLFLRRPEVNIAAVLGTLVYPTLDATANIVGTAILLVVGIAGAFLYAALLLVFRLQSNGSMGGWYGALLWLSAMILLPVLITVHPMTRAGVFQTPDLFYVRVFESWGPALFMLAAYLVYGFLLGGIYRNLPRRSVT